MGYRLSLKLRTQENHLLLLPALDVVGSNIMSFLSKEILVTPLGFGFQPNAPETPFLFTSFPSNNLFQLANQEECAP